MRSSFFLKVTRCARSTIRVQSLFDRYCKRYLQSCNAEIRFSCADREGEDMSRLWKRIPETIRSCVMALPWFDLSRPVITNVMRFRNLRKTLLVSRYKISTPFVSNKFPELAFIYRSEVTA